MLPRMAIVQSFAGYLVVDTDPPAVSNSSIIAASWPFARDNVCASLLALD